MQFSIQHKTSYRYDRPVQLGPHIVRLLPRNDGRQRLLDYQCSVTPHPVLQSNVLDAAGNQVTHLWFSGTTTELHISIRTRIVTVKNSAYDFIVDTPATGIPVAYSGNEQHQLAAYREPVAHTLPRVNGLAARLARKSGYNTLVFLDTLNSYLHTGLEREIRVQGPPQDPELTLARRRGACRDLAMLFIAVCRDQGIASRFVSGYQAHAETRGNRRHLHAWPEVYIPGGGWRGYDPSHASLVVDGHVALAAACTAAGAMPVDGSYYGDGAHAGMDFELSIQTDN